MIRFFTRCFFIPFCILLFGGFAQTHQHGIGNPLEGFLSDHITKDSHSRKNKESIKAIKTADDDDLDPKHADDGNDYSSFHSTHSIYYIYEYLKNRLPLCEHFSYSSSSTFLIQRAIRI